MNVQENVIQIKERIEKACERVNRNPKDVKIIAVTKYVSVETAQLALEAGIKDLGENRDQGLIDKYEVIGNEATWHFIGSLQSRKVKDIIDKVAYIHSLDRKSLAKEINKRATQKVKCFVQVNTSGEQSKHGLQPDDTISFIESLAELPNIEVIGLMTMAPFVEDENVLRDTFKHLKELQNIIIHKRLPFAPCTELSMGMSNDFEIAVEEGATYIRIGTALVGKEY
ncbi:YggS family pyridoxal phosphate-dependent enzyme [Bacillus solimangrovi]|uniref:Pyridoxal phosphate homeostasis protein n=1 Tax=Bacillus solimangrovi TaxID=1305675 RepID=A0A1E5LAT7_9BACI|nr:YggS family pyridoxal phosphate-dependent enzyme [Bacillus solimangrovi]OEH91181.1 YggS family pyridoxal phosphate enzyme [Bacillus solimangrovi]